MGGGGFVETCCNNAFLSTSVALETKTHDFRIVFRLYTANEVQKPKCLNEAPSELTLASCCEKETGVTTFWGSLRLGTPGPHRHGRMGFPGPRSTVRMGTLTPIFTVKWGSWDPYCIGRLGIPL